MELSWFIEKELRASQDIENYAKSNNLSMRDVWYNDRLMEQLSEKYHKLYGYGPHDCNQRVIVKGDKVVFGMACGNTSVLAKGTVVDVNVENQKVKINQTHSNGYTESNPKNKWYQYSQRMMVV